MGAEIDRVSCSDNGEIDAILLRAQGVEILEVWRRQCGRAMRVG